MTILEFDLLNEAGKAQILWNHSCIGGREETNYKVLLYQVDSFYVEVYFHRREHEIKKFRSFSSMEELDPYLEKIELREELWSR